MSNNETPDTQSTEDENHGGEVAMPNVHALTGKTAEAVKKQTVKQRAAIARQQVALRKQADEMKADFERQRDEMQQAFWKRQRELEQQMEPIKAQLERMEEVVWTLDLFLGRHETVELIKDGTPARADTPITIRQMVLAADEESLIHGDSGGIDFREMSSFTEWLCESPENRDRVVPDAKSVVVIVPSKRDRDYGDPYYNAHVKEMNTRAHWIIRNGERIYLMVTDPELKVGSRLIPQHKEFMEFFYKKSWGGAEPEPLDPGSEEWVKAEEKADKVKRHYMRLMLVLQGLIERSVAFHPLPEGGVNLLSLDAQNSGKVVLLNEIDLALEDGRPSFREWQKELNSQMRPGVRVVLGNGISQHNYGSNHWEGNARISPSKAEFPPTGVPLLIEGKRAGGFVVKYERTEETWRRVKRYSNWGRAYYEEELSVPERRASAVLTVGDSWVLPFDLASTEDLTYYLNSRKARTDYINMVPVIKAALEAKEEEFEAEAPLRKLLADTIEQKHPDASRAEVEEGLDELVRWWKVGNKWSRALTGDQEAEAKASKSILKEWELRREAAGDPKVNAAVVTAAKKKFPDLLAVALLRTGKHVAYVATDAAQGPWLTEYELDKKGAITSKNEWVTIAPRRLSTMLVLHEGDGWGKWEKRPDVKFHLTGPERDALVSEVSAGLTAAGATPICITERLPDEPDGWGEDHVALFTGFGWKKDVDVSDREVYVGNTDKWPRNGTRGIVNFMDVVLLTWTRERDGSITSKPFESRYVRGNEWERHSAEFGKPSLPFVTGQESPYGDGFRTLRRHILRWKDDKQFDKALAVLDAHKKKSEAEREEGQENRAAARGWVEELHRAWRARQIAGVREEFNNDFGEDADDLWEHHLSTLRLPQWSLPRRIEDMFERLVNASVPIDGKTVDELVEIDAGLTTEGKKIDVGDFGELVVRKKEEKPEGDSDGEKYTMRFSS